LIAKMPSI